MLVLKAKRKEKYFLNKNAKSNLKKKEMEEEHIQSLNVNIHCPMYIHKVNEEK